MRDAAALVSIAVGFLTIVSTLGRVFIYRPIVRLIEERTTPIQRHANGGLSLPDVAKTVQRIEAKIDRHIEWHMEQK